MPRNVVRDHLVSRFAALLTLRFRWIHLLRSQSSQRHARRLCQAPAESVLPPATKLYLLVLIYIYIFKLIYQLIYKAP